jgi:hypothetical protein
MRKMLSNYCISCSAYWKCWWNCCFLHFNCNIYIYIYIYIYIILDTWRFFFFDLMLIIFSYASILSWFLLWIKIESENKEKNTSIKLTFLSIFFFCFIALFLSYLILHYFFLFSTTPITFIQQIVLKLKFDYLIWSIKTFYFNILSWQKTIIKLEVFE